MENDGKTKAGREMVGDIPVRTEEIGFPHADLIACTKCSKLNSPQRGACLYCGSVLAAEANRDAAKHEAHGPLEEWEIGYNVAITHAPDSGSLPTATNLLGLEAEVTELLANGRLPAARLDTEASAMRILENLNKVGVAWKRAA